LKPRATQQAEVAKQIFFFFIFLCDLLDRLFNGENPPRQPSGLGADPAGGQGSPVAIVTTAAYPEVNSLLFFSFKESQGLLQLDHVIAARDARLHSDLQQVLVLVKLGVVHIELVLVVHRSQISLLLLGSLGGDLGKAFLRREMLRGITSITGDSLGGHVGCLEKVAKV
jgi:hypothetical protein